MSSKSQKFIILEHIYDGADAWGIYNWDDFIEGEITERYFSLFEKYADKIQVEWAGHNHNADFRAELN